MILFFIKGEFFVKQKILYMGYYFNSTTINCNLDAGVRDWWFGVRDVF